MTSPFREAAFESRIKGFSNPISIQGSLPIMVMLLFLVLCVAGLCTYGYFTNYTRKANVVGYLNPQSGGIAISAPIGGQLSLPLKTDPINL